MIHLALTVVESVSAALAIFALGYYALCLWSAKAFLHSQKRQLPATGTSNGTLPPVSVLKPLKGVDPHLYQALRSHCVQDYPVYEIVFGVNDPSDPALQIVDRLRKEFPERPIECVVCDKDLGTNTKVSNLAQMLRRARYECLVISDSDILVPQNYLQRVATPLDDATVGVVTCLYRGIAAPTLGSRLESLGISTDFVAGVLVASYLENGLGFGFGSTLVLRRGDLDAIGGFEPLLNYLADDYELAHRIAGLGLRVHVSELVVDTFLPAYKLPDFSRHQMRWARGIRHCRPGGYAGLAFTFGVPWAVLAFAASGAALWSGALLGATITARLVTAAVVADKVLDDSQVPALLWLLPLRDASALAIWLFSFAGDSVTWRGKRFHLKDGKLERIGLDISQ